MRDITPHGKISAHALADPKNMEVPMRLLAAAVVFALIAGSAQAAPDLVNGAKQFNKCKSCHTIVKGGKHLVGPNLNGVFGRKAGSATGFNYSPAMKAVTYKWDEAKLDTYLTDPRGTIKGNRMSFPGIKVVKDRADLIAYLKANAR